MVRVSGDEVRVRFAVVCPELANSLKPGTTNHRGAEHAERYAFRLASHPNRRAFRTVAGDQGKTSATRTLSALDLTPRSVISSKVTSTLAVAGLVEQCLLYFIYNLFKFFYLSILSFSLFLFYYFLF